MLELGSDDVIIPGTANLSFNIMLSSMADPKGVLVSNLGSAVVKSLQLNWNDILGVDEFDVYACY